MLGVITGVGGGILRDLCIGEIPSVLGGNTLFNTMTVVGGDHTIGGDIDHTV